jgi:Ca2+/Na+ antiporter
MEVVEMFIPVAFCAMIVLVVYFTTKYNYQTKKAIIDKGVNIELKKKKFPFLEIGLTAIGIGLGLAIAAFPLSSNLSKEIKELLIGAFTLLFGGVGLVSAFFIRIRLEEKK